ncbi:MAG: exodeoxyribonuclease VII large subunit [Granulosicoccus sp.]
MEKKIFTVSRLNQEVQKLLESGFGTLWLQGELSNFSRPASGHFYFSIKDSQSQIRCAMFKGRNRYIDFQPASGDAVVVRGKLGLYSARGDFQLIVEHMEPAGAGKLQAAFEATKRELDAKGWFDVNNKLELPSLPQTIGVVTSPTSAALRDVLQVLNRRYRQCRIIIYPTLTQGGAAAPAIVKALDQANKRNEADVLLLVRGGGSLEDLWAFNELSVASAIRDSNIPIVAGIGHEVDVTISDLVSDLRAPTPSAAAELSTPDTQSLQLRVEAARKNLGKIQRRRLIALNQTLTEQLTRLHLRHPSRQLSEQMQRVDELEHRLRRAWLSLQSKKTSKLDAASMRLGAHSPAQQLEQHHSRLDALASRLHGAVQNQQHLAKSRFDILVRALHGVSPLAVLDRGYAIIKKNETPVTSISVIQTGDEITTRLAKGELVAIVQKIKPIEN